VFRTHDIAVVDAWSWTAEELEREVAEQKQAPFELASGQIFRARIYSLAKREQRLLICVHAVAADAESLPILVEEFTRIYNGLEGRKSGLRSALTRERAAKIPAPASVKASLAFWAEQLSGQTPELTLPFDRRRTPDTRTISRGNRELFLSHNVRHGIEALSRLVDVPLRTVYLAAYSVLLSRYAAAAEVRVGFSATMRNGEARDSSIANLFNAITITADCSAVLSVEQMLKKINDDATRALPHQHVPLPLVLRHVNSAGTNSLREYFQGYFSWERLRKPALRFDSPIAEILALQYSSAPVVSFDLGLAVEEREGSLHLYLLFQEDLFEASTIERIAGHWTRLMEDLAAAELAPTVAHLEMMPDEERALVLSRYAGGSSEYPWACLHDLFAEQVRIRPEAEALVFGSERFTYRRLDERSNQIARFLQGVGIEHGDRVGIFMDRSADMIVSMLGVLKAGAAYVPIDPDYPAERLKFIAEDTDVKHVLTARRVHAKLPVSAPMSYLDDPDSPISLSATEAVSHGASPESVAIVIYTSGSTGLPKAACIPHRAAVRTVRNQNYVEVRVEDRVAQVASPSFDAAIMETWLALVNGATLVGMSRETLLGPAELTQFLELERVSIMVLNTAYLHQIGRDAPHVLARLRKILFGGEAAESGPMRLLLKHVAPGVLVNGYGPAEGCVISTYFAIESIGEDATTVPIGRPVANAQIYLLDSLGRPVPIGMQGEIYIGGEGVANGYWNRPELTAQRFIPDTFSGRTDRLLYRTGDLACMRGNGLLEFRGRADEQVKIRGHRIELAEVRQAIEAHPDVKQVFLMVREDQPGDKRLTAYLTLHQPLPNLQETLRQHTKQKLPAHMLPAAFVVLDAIPINTNGKVDRKALPPPVDRPELVSTYQEAQSDLEEALTVIWRELLRVDQVGVNDNFFDLGGHSLLAARLIARIETETGQNMPVAGLFEAPTIAKLAAKLRRKDYAANWSPLVQLRAGENTDTASVPFFCVHSLGANLVSFHKIASLMRGGRPVYGLQPHGLDGKEKPLESIEAMAASYVQEILKKQPQGPYHLGGVCIGGVLAYEIAQQLQGRGEQVALIALIDSFLPGKLEYQHPRRNWIEYLDGHLGEMLRLPVWESLAYFCRWAANGGVLLARVLGCRDNSSLGEATRRIADAHIKAANTYQPKPYGGKIIQFMCSDGPHRSYEDRRLAWSVLVPGGFEVRIVPGDHLSMVEEPNVTVLAEQLEAALDRIDGISAASAAADDNRPDSQIAL
jgi:amino acid adenylation domain-containing protein